MQWTQKESMLLQDMMNSEQICIDKYTDYADRACDEELRTLFESIKTTEEEHLKTLEQMQSGTIPAMNAQSGSQKQQDSSSGSGGSKKQSKAC